MSSTDENSVNFNPYPGLRAFEEDEDFLFFGREEQIDELLSRLRKSRFLAVVGSSGSGKSSLVKSGLLPALYGGYMAQTGSAWDIVTFRPAADPIGELAEALLKLSKTENMPQSAQKQIILSNLNRDKNGIAETFKQINVSKTNNILLLIDQFEEIFRFNKSESEIEGGKSDASTFIKLITNSVKQY